MAAPKRGRLVLTHSTHIPGLIAVLERLTANEHIQTITPAVIRHGRSHSPRFTLKVSVAILGGYKVIARRGKTCQEVFIITSLKQDILEAAIAQALK